MMGKGTKTKMSSPTLLAIIALAALIHASFQLSVSMLTLLSGHALGAKKRHARVMSLVGSFTLGSATMTMLLVAALAYFALAVFGTQVPVLVWSVVCGLMSGIAIAVWIFYYRRQSGTALWLPRPLAAMLHERTMATKYNAEAFSLGLTSVIAELLFALPLLLAAAFSLAQLPFNLQLAGIVMYVIISTLPLAYVSILVGGGHSISRIQQWREANKKFLQVAAGTALFILSFYIYVNAVLAPMLLQEVW